eukprot:CAMPEP_0172449460 /NCGR_PEP_ID=MMETSP1065-20121228/8170_1 /TAXON_ID=265537 /ORGANISM="Amphiprora paludosa, Strain CCMP125" /LENGTH=365 /DNA_ID=CAMNT_0013201143 /DNA_START=147 /DNA_END=1244 /DNA_ORIENTATION=-
MSPIVATTAPVELTWTRLDTQLTPDPVNGDAPPLARSSHGVSFLEQSQQIFIYGGEHVARTPLVEGDANKSIYGWLADLSQKKWIALTAEAVVPPPRIAQAQAVAGDNVYIFGGRAGITMSEQAMNDIWVWNATTQTWKDLTTATQGTPPEPRSFHSMICVDNSLYVFGGCGQTSGRLADLHQLDLTTLTWTNLGTSLLRGRGGPNLLPLANGEKVAVVSGFAGEETKDGHVFDLASKTWDASLLSGLDDLRPRSVCVSGSFPAAGVSIIFGGEVDPSERGHEGAGGFTNDIVILNESTGALLETIAAPSDATNWPGNRGWSSGGSFNDAANGSGSLYIFGGLAGDDVKPIRLSDLWELKVTKKS